MTFGGRETCKPDGQTRQRKGEERVSQSEALKGARWIEYRFRTKQSEVEETVDVGGRDRCEAGFLLCHRFGPFAASCQRCRAVRLPAASSQLPAVSHTHSELLKSPSVNQSASPTTSNKPHCRKKPRHQHMLGIEPLGSHPLLQSFSGHSWGFGACLGRLSD